MSNLNILTRDVDLDLLVATVREVASERPEHRYSTTEGCMYFLQSGAPDCIIGHALHRLGVQPHEVKEGDSPNDGEADPRIHWLRRVQAEQDAGLKWGDCIELADSEAQLKVAV
jgi:hypothetical protein